MGFKEGYLNNMCLDILFSQEKVQYLTNPSLWQLEQHSDVPEKYQSVLEQKFFYYQNYVKFVDVLQYLNLLCLMGGICGGISDVLRQYDIGKTMDGIIFNDSCFMVIVSISDTKHRATNIKSKAQNENSQAADAKIKTMGPQVNASVTNKNVNHVEKTSVEIQTEGRIYIQPKRYSTHGLKSLEKDNEHFITIQYLGFDNEFHPHLNNVKITSSDSVRILVTQDNTLENISIEQESILKQKFQDYLEKPTPPTIQVANPSIQNGKVSYHFPKSKFVLSVHSQETKLKTKEEKKRFIEEIKQSIQQQIAYNQVMQSLGCQRQGVNIGPLFLDNRRDG